MVKSSSMDPGLVAPVWGALWGAALGTWLLIPDIISAHHIRPEGAGHWTLLLVSLVLIFAVVGAFLAFISGFLLALVEHLTVRRFRDRVWAYALFTGILVVIGYGLEDYVIYLTTFHRFDTLAFSLDQMKGLAVFVLAMSAVLTFAYRLITTSGWRVRPLSLGVVLIGAAAGGAITAPARTLSENLQSSEVASLSARETQSANPPLLFVGVDGATWRVLGPAMEAGLAPTFRSLMERGTSGDVDALWSPYWSGPAWASILTGLPREATGIYEDLAAVAPGLPPFQVPLFPSFKLRPMYTVRAYLEAARVIEFVLPTRPMLRGKPVWQLLHDAGVDTAVIRFRFTYPPANQADVIVSDWIGSDSWEQLGVRHRISADAVAPPRLAQQLLAPFLNQTADSSVFGRLIPGPLPDKPDDAVFDPFAYIRPAADVDERTFQVSAIVLKRNAKQPFLAVYIAGLDAAEHAFWQYRFPEDFESNRPSSEDIARYAHVIDRYIQFVDERLKSLLTLYDEEPNVVIVSDHGHGASTVPLGWRGWHTKEGIFLAAGPSVPKSKSRIGVSYYDIVPTLAALKGFDKPSGLRGVALFRGTQPLSAASNSR